MCRDLEVTPFVAFENMKKNSSICISCLLKVSLVKCLRTFMNKGLFQFPQLKVSHCDFNGSSANEPDHSKLSDNVSKAYNNPNMSNLVEATRRKEGRVQTLGQPNQLHRCTRNVISRGRISVCDRRLRGWLRALSCVLLLSDRHSMVSSFHPASVFDIIYIKPCRLWNKPFSHIEVKCTQQLHRQRGVLWSLG